MKDYKRYLITAALPYTNGAVHIGHLAGVYVPSDIYVRYLRARKRDVKFICGSDEHGVPITIKAKEMGVSPQAVVDKYHEIIKKSFIGLGVTFDIYSRTTSKIHHKTASDFFKKLYDEGKFIEKTSEQYYDEEAKQFLADRYIVGTCPHCGNDNAYGDQCEKCGSTLSPDELINPHSSITGNSPILKETSHWYLPLDQYQTFLEKWILEDHKEWKPNVYGQCKSWLTQGLQPRAVSRDLDWGVPLPVKGGENKVLYVWFDAPIGYISNTIELLPDTWETYWKDEDTKLVHFIGKDNIVFHCIVFPSMLKAHGDFILPDNVPGNEFLNLEGDKISTSRNWAVWLHEYLEDFPGKADVLRYVLCANAPETKDNDFTWKEFQNRNNTELVAVFGNFVNRVMVLTNKYFDGVVPEIKDLTDFDKETIAELVPTRERIENALETYHFREALKEAMYMARLGNKYLADSEPWKLAKMDMDKVGTILNISLQICANLSIVMEPFLPFSAEKLAKMLNFTNGNWEDIAKIDLLPSGHKINEAVLLFDKIEDEDIQKQLDKLEAAKALNSQKSKKVEAQKEVTTFDDFTKMDIRVATIKEAEKVKKTNKLLKLTVDTGIDTRTIVSGIAEYYTPESLIGQQVCMLVNLEPRMIKGIESQGMILMASDSNGKMKLVKPSEEIDNGAAIS